MQVRVLHPIESFSLAGLNKLNVKRAEQDTAPRQTFFREKHESMKLRINPLEWELRPIKESKEYLKIELAFLCFRLFITKRPPKSKHLSNECEFKCVHSHGSKTWRGKLTNSEVDAITKIFRD